MSKNTQNNSALFFSYSSVLYDGVRSRICGVFVISAYLQDATVFLDLGNDLHALFYSLHVGGDQSSVRIVAFSILICIATLCL